MNGFQRWNKNRINYLYFSYDDFFDYDNFVMELSQVLNSNVQYSLLLKVKYNSELYAMLGNQIGFLYKQGYDVNDFEIKHKVFSKRIKDFIDRYGVEVINSIQLLYVRIEDIPQLKIKNLSKVNFKPFTTEKDSKSRFSIIPLTVNENYFGKLILKDRDLYLNKINAERALLDQDVLDIDNFSSMYLYKDYLILTSEKDGIIYRDIYDAVSGTLYTKISDKVLSDNLFIRKIGNNSLTVLNNTIIKLESERKLSHIKYIPKPLKDESNTLIGS